MARPTELTDDVRSYIRSVSRSLAGGDVHLADELEQETCLAALKDGPREPRALHAWLRAVARNCLRSRRARVATRPRMESIGARTFEGTMDDPAECVATEEIREALRGHLGSLPRRYSSVVSLRLMEGLPPREIASRLDMPVETVRTRVRRGVERLRDDVERSVGGQDALRPHRPLLGLAAFIPRRVRLGAAAALPAAAVLGVVHFAGAPDDAAIADDTRVAVAPAAALTGAALPSPLDADAGRGEPGPFVDAAGDLPPEAEPLSRNEQLLQRLPGAKLFEVRVVDAEGRPAPGAGLYLRRGLNGHTWRAATTGADGTAEVVAIPRLRWIAARGPAGQLSVARLVEQPQLISRAALELTLRPVDVDWVRIEGAPVGSKARLAAIDAVSNQCSMDAGLGIVGPALWVPAWRDAQGRFGFADHGLPGRIEVIHGRSLAYRSAMLHGDLPGSIEVTRGWSASGRALDAGGAPLAERLVSVFEATAGGPELFSVRTDAAGNFTTPRIFCDGVRIALASGSMSFAVEPEKRAAADEAAQPIGDLLFRDQPAGRPAFLRGTVVGPVEGMRLTPIRFTEATLSLAHRAQLKHHRASPVTVKADGSFVVARAPAEIGALLVEFEGSGAAPCLVTRPRDGWDSMGVRIDPGASLGAAVRIPLRAVERPATLFFAEERSGFLRVEEVDASARDAFVELDGLPPGRYEMMAQTATGRTVVVQGIELEAGQVRDLAALDQEFGTARVDWDEVEAAGAPDDRMRVTVTACGADGDTLIETTPLRFRCERNALALELQEIELRQGEHRVEVRGPAAGWSAVVQVTAGQVVDVALAAAAEVAPPPGR